MKNPGQLFLGRLLIALVGGLVCAALYWYSGVRPLDRAIYDALNEAAPMALADDVVIVGIDESSLAELGRWPWPRENHVQLLRELRDAKVRAVAVDVLFAEPYQQYPQVDAMLAEVIEQLGNVVLPVFIGRASPGGPLREIGPVPQLAQAAAGIGHVHIEVDNDGVARGVYLREGLGAPRWNHLAVVLAQVVGYDLSPLPGISNEAVLRDPDPDAIIRSHANLIPFMGDAGTVAQVPYVDVMKGRADPALLRDKIVFVGATAAGHVDNITTSLGQISGVEINATIFSALREQALMRPAPSWPVAVLGGLFVTLLLFFVTRLAPGRLLVVVVASVFLFLFLSYVLLTQARLWVSPAPVVLTILFAYPLWNWLRLATAMDFIQDQLVQLRKENTEGFLAPPPAETVAASRPDPVDEVLLQLDGAYREARQNHELVRGTLEQLASGVILAELSGAILMVNDEARDILGGPVREKIVEAALSRIQLGGDKPLRDLLAGLTAPGDVFETEAVAIDSGRDLLLQGGVVGFDRPLLLLVLTDVTALKQSEKQRTEALNFLSHDLRAPLTSVLALLQSAREDSTQRADPALLSQIEKYIRANLSYAENFIQLAKLDQAGPMIVDECDAHSLLDNAVAQLYHSAASRSIALNITVSDDDLWLNCSRDLVERVLINLLDNAIKHSEDGGEIDLGLEPEGDNVLFTVRDCGPGIDPQDIQRIFEQFQQGGHARSGAGLGLRFVQAVADAHGGTITAVNHPDGGSRFELRLPLA